MVAGYQLLAFNENKALQKGGRDKKRSRDFKKACYKRKRTGEPTPFHSRPQPEKAIKKYVVQYKGGGGKNDGKGTRVEKKTLRTRGGSRGTKYIPKFDRLMP